MSDFTLKPDSRAITKELSNRSKKFFNLEHEKGWPNHVQDTQLREQNIFKGNDLNVVEYASELSGL